MNTPEDREGLEARLDEALRTIAGHREPGADLRARVMAAIDASEATRSTRPRASAFALAAIAIAAIAVAVWLAGRPGPTPVRVDTRTASPAVPVPEASPRTDQAGAEPLPRGAEPGTRPDPGRRAAAVLRGPARATDLATSIATLPPLDAPEPLAIERLEGPPLTVARLEIEGLAFEPLEVTSLDSLEKE